MEMFSAHHDAELQTENKNGQDSNQQKTVEQGLDALSLLRAGSAVGLGAVVIAGDEALKLHSAKATFRGLSSTDTKSIYPSALSTKDLETRLKDFTSEITKPIYQSAPSSQVLETRFKDFTSIYPSALSTQVLEARNSIGPLVTRHQLDAKQLLASENALRLANGEARAVAELYKDVSAVELEFGAELAWRRHHFLTQANNLDLFGYNGIKAEHIIGTEMEARNSSKIFADGTREATMLRQLEQARNADVQAINSLRHTSTLLERNFGQLDTFRKEIPSASYESAFQRGLKNGVIASGASIIGGYAADKMLGIKTAENSMARLALDGIVTPAALSSDLPQRYRIGIAATSFISSRVLGAIDGCTTEDQQIINKQPSINSSLKLNLTPGSGGAR